MGGTMIITNCVVTENTALYGGGIGCFCGNLIINNCLITGNIAHGGGGIAATGDNSGHTCPEIINCTFSGNIATMAGGAIYCGELSSPSVVNSILWGDNAIYGSEIAMSNVDWGSALSISYSDVQGGKAGIPGGYDLNCYLHWGLGNFDTDPCFVDPCNGDYHLKSEGWRWDETANQWTWDNVTSRCIDAGNPGYSLGDEPITLLVDPLNRFGVNKRIDMGTYGGTPEASMPPYDWALLADLDNNGTVDFSDFAKLADNWHSAGVNQPGDLNRSGLIDLNDIVLFVADWLKVTGWH
jgi:predicted outer membrane repeat protein